MLAEAISLLDAGFSPLALHSLLPDGRCGCQLFPRRDGRPRRCETDVPGRGKHPIGSGWQTTAPTADGLAALHASYLRDRGVPPNLGWRMGLQPNGRHLICVDVDDPAVFAAALQGPLASLGPLPDTRGKPTPGGGMHLVYAVPDATLIGNSVKGALPGADVRSAGGQIVIAPSVGTKGAYAAFDAAPIAELPAAWVAHLVDRSRKRLAAQAVAASDGPAVRVDDPAVVAHVRALVATWSPDEKGSRSATWVAAFRLVRGWCLAAAPALDLLRAYNAMSLAPHADAFLEEKVYKAEHEAEQRWGAELPIEWCRHIGIEPDITSPPCAHLGLPLPPVPPAAPEAPAPPTVDPSGLRLAPGGWPWVLRKGTWCWLHEVDRQAYGSAFERTDLRLQIKRSHGRVIPIIYPKDKGGVAELTPAELESGWECRVSELKATYLARANTWDAASGTLTLAALKWAPLAARPHADVDEWLRALGGDEYPRLAQWLASCVALHRPAPALYIYGELQVGKSLLARGIARLWQTEPAPFSEALDSFNEAAATCPLMFSDEGFPEGMSFNVFREMVTSPTRRVNEKYKPKYPVEGCVRIILATNNAQALRYQRTGVLTSTDIRAISDRLLVLPARDEAGKVLARLDAASFVNENKVAEHCLWLASTVSLQPRGERMCVASGGGGGSLLDALQRAKYTLVLRVLQSAAEAAGVIADGERMLVNIRRLAAAVQAEAHLSHQAGKLTEGDVRDFCEAFRAGPGERRRLTADGNPLWFVPLDVQRVLTQVDALD